MTSLHTIYRPKSLDEVVGQDHVIKGLEQVILDQRAHSFIFTGPAGTGKTTLARILANEFAEGAATVSNIEEIDAASTNGVEAVRAIANRTLFRAVGASPVKTIIMDEAHRLSGAAWTALLKSVEEPPKHIYWIFCTTEPGKIPKPIQTRCLKYDLKLVSEELLLKLLKRVTKFEKLEIKADVLEAIAEASGGSPRQSLVYLEACLYCNNAREAQQIMRNAGQSREAIDLCRFLLNPQGGWAQAIKIIKAIDGVEPESIRITVCNYLGTVLLNEPSEKKARHLMMLLESFSEEYRQSERHAPLLRSVGLALGMDQ